MLKSKICYAFFCEIILQLSNLIRLCYNSLGYGQKLLNSIYMLAKSSIIILHAVFLWFHVKILQSRLVDQSTHL